MPVTVPAREVGRGEPIVRPTPALQSEFRMIRIARLATGVAVAVALAPFAGVAAANAAPPAPTPPAPYDAVINQGNVPTTAGGYSNQQCSEDEFGNKAA